MPKIEVVFAKSEGLPVNVIAVRRTNTFEIAFFCTRCKNEITRIGKANMFDATTKRTWKEEVVKLRSHKCKEERDENC